jgi:hypothetical protein
MPGRRLTPWVSPASQRQAATTTVEDSSHGRVHDHTRTPYPTTARHR